MKRVICAAALALAGYGVSLAAATSEPERVGGGSPNIILETTKATASDGDPGDNFGAAVALTNNRAVVGATGEDSLGFEAGAAYIYERQEDGVNWNQVAKITATDGATDDMFGGAVDVEEDTIVVGAPFNDFAVNNGGSAYVFYRNENAEWEQVAQLNAQDAGDDEFFGLSASISGDTIVVGSLDDELGDRAGAAYVFERNAGGADNWGQVAKLQSSEGGVDDRFGDTVDVSGDTIVVGAPEGQLPPQPVTGAGAAYIFQRDESDPFSWNEFKILRASDGDFGDLFGWSATIAGDFVAIGAALDDELGLDSGSAYIFERDAGGTDNWGEVKKLNAFDGGMNDGFGISVSLSEQQLVVGAFNDDDEGNNAGAAHIWVRDFNGDGLDLWQQVGKLLASDGDDAHMLGSSVAWGGSQIMVGAPGIDIAYVYDLSRFFEPFPNCIGFPGTCDRLDVVTTFTLVSGTWVNWDCEGSDVPITGTSINAGEEALILCSDPGCPLGNVWGHRIEFIPGIYDLWSVEDGDPPVQVINNDPIVLFNGPCSDAPQADGTTPSYLMGNNQ